MDGEHKEVKDGMPSSPPFLAGMLGWKRFALPVPHEWAFRRMLGKHQRPQITPPTPNYKAPLAGWEPSPREDDRGLRSTHADHITPFQSPFSISQGQRLQTPTEPPQADAVAHAGP